MTVGWLFKCIIFFFHLIAWFRRQSAFYSQHTLDLLFALCVCVCLREGRGCIESLIQKTSENQKRLLLQRGESMTSLFGVIQIVKQMTVTSENQVRRAGQCIFAFCLWGLLWIVCIWLILLILLQMEWVFYLFFVLKSCGSDLTVMLYFLIFNN